MTKTTKSTRGKKRRRSTSRGDAPRSKPAAALAPVVDAPPPAASPPVSPSPLAAWRLVNRVQLAELLGVHQDTISDYRRQGMVGVIDPGGHGREGVYDSVTCLEWWRDRQGKNAKEAAQTKLYENNAILAALKIAREKGELLAREDVVKDGKALVKGLSAQVRALPRRSRHAGIISTQAQEVQLAALCRSILEEIVAWQTIDDIEQSAVVKDDDAAA